MPFTRHLVRRLARIAAEHPETRPSLMSGLRVEWGKKAGTKARDIPETEVKDWKSGMRRHKGQKGPGGVKFGQKVKHQGKDWLVYDFDADARAPGGSTMVLVSPDYKKTIRDVELPGSKKARVAKDLPPDVERYVQEGKDDGMGESKAWAIAWSRYCRKEPGSPHCQQDEYFHGKGPKEAGGRIAVQLPSEERDGKPGYDDDFKAGYKAGKAAYKKNDQISASNGERAYKRVSKKYGQWWEDGYNAAIDLERGAYATKPAQIAKKLKLASAMPRGIREARQLFPAPAAEIFLWMARVASEDALCRPHLMPILHDYFG